MDKQPLQKQIKVCEDQKSSAHSWISQIETFQHELAASQLQLEEKTRELAQREAALSRREEKLALHLRSLRVGMERARVSLQEMQEMSLRNLLLACIEGTYTVTFMNLNQIHGKVILSTNQLAPNYESPGYLRMEIAQASDPNIKVKFACCYKELFHMDFAAPNELILWSQPPRLPLLTTQGALTRRDDKPVIAEVLAVPERVQKRARADGPEEVQAMVGALAKLPGPTVSRMLYRLGDPSCSSTK